MCGIVGYIGSELAAPIIFESLSRVSYRGYDSAGIATLNGHGVELLRETGKLSRLGEVLARNPLLGTVGIGHTRWATHGVPSVLNAHPHVAGQVAVVHNGIIENHQLLRRELESKGVVFGSQTDTETVPQLINYYLADGLEDPIGAARKALARLEGSYALCILFESEKNFLLAARKGSPLVVGLGPKGAFIGSDELALAVDCERVIYLDDGDLAVVTESRITFYDKIGNVVERKGKSIGKGSRAVVTKGGYDHFMLKEIHEQPGVVAETVKSLVSPATGQIILPELPFGFRDISRMSLVACGTSSYAGLTARYWFESIAGLATDWDIASEFRYRDLPIDHKSGFIGISQSGETADTLAVMKELKRNGVGVVSLVNVPTSAMARLADATIYTLAGPEIAVASTKAFTTQLAALACIAIYAGRIRGKLDVCDEEAMLKSLYEVPVAIEQVISLSGYIRDIASHIVKTRDVFFLGRGSSYPIALEGALKLKEISYIHAEGFAAGELKHGPLALIGEGVPVVVLAPRDKHFDKTVSNLQEVKARGGQILLLSDESGCDVLKEDVWKSIQLPDCGVLGNPMVYAVALQLLAYHVSVLKGIDPDMPRNLAKSVTVE